MGWNNCILQNYLQIARYPACFDGIPDLQFPQYLLSMTAYRMYADTQCLCNIPACHPLVYQP